MSQLLSAERTSFTNRRKSLKIKNSTIRQNCQITKLAISALLQVILKELIGKLLPPSLTRNVAKLMLKSQVTYHKEYSRTPRWIFSKRLEKVYLLLNNKISWNLALSGSFILLRRKPNIFITDIPFSLNFLTR